MLKFCAVSEKSVRKTIEATFAYFSEILRDYSMFNLRLHAKNLIDFNNYQITVLV